MSLKTENLKTYRVFVTMHHRCCSPVNKGFHRYGGRGIAVCHRWHDFASFLADMGPQPPGMVLDRINNDGDYAPDNCRWVSPKESMRNTSRNRLVTAFGRTACASEWAEEMGLPRMAVIHRLNRGWSAEEALSIPIGFPRNTLAMFKQMAPALKRAGVL